MTEVNTGYRYGKRRHAPYSHIMDIIVSRLGDLIRIEQIATAFRGITRIIRPGESTLGKSYAEWAILPSGEHNVDLKIA
jgi:hypothetical protein